MEYTYTDLYKDILEYGEKVIKERTGMECHDFCQNYINAIQHGKEEECLKYEVSMQTFANEAEIMAAVGVLTSESIKTTDEFAILGLTEIIIQNADARNPDLGDAAAYSKYFVCDYENHVLAHENTKTELREEADVLGRILDVEITDDLFKSQDLER